MIEEMKIRAIAPWFGGKRTLAEEIVRELGKHTQYFEPFCGSAAVLFAKDRDLYAGWTFVEKTMNKNLHVQASRGRGQTKEAPEILIINGPSYTKGAK